MSDAQQLLDEARAAWLDARMARAQLSRLRGYARLTAGMKDDQRRHAAKLAKAEAVLARILDGAP